jgi:hypothetical protein
MRVALALVVAFAIGSQPALSEANPLPLITKVDHVYVVSDRPEQLYNFFQQRLQLPIAWPYADYGGFASGAVSLGNAALEFVKFKAAPNAAVTTKFDGIGFEPVDNARAATSRLASMGIPHGPQEPFKFSDNGAEHVAWTTIELRHMHPSGPTIFLCDYADRKGVAETQKKAAEELSSSNGGTLGVTSLAVIILDVTSVTGASHGWEKLQDSVPKGHPGTFTFGHGPVIRLVQAGTESFAGIVMSVKSLERAQKFLSDNKMLGHIKTQEISIDPKVVDGLQITLVQQASNAGH